MSTDRRPGMRTALLFSVLMLTSSCRPPSAPGSSPPPSSDLAAARALFERNLDAIRNKDQAAYLDCYRADEQLIRVGKKGVATGFDELAAGTSSRAEAWPSRFEARDLEVHPVAPGLVYGHYRYEVVIDGKVRRGQSERIFMKTTKGWKIAVTTAFDD